LYANAWTMPRSEVRGLLKGAVPIYLDAALSSAFVACWWVPR
jgi:hypothetical protein